MKAPLYFLLGFLLILLCSCEQSLYTPAVFPSPEIDPKNEIRGPAFHSFPEAQAWAIGEMRRRYPNAVYIVYKDLYWNNEYGVEMAKEKLK